MEGTNLTALGATDEKIELIYRLYYKCGEINCEWTEDFYLDIDLISGKVGLRREKDEDTAENKHG